MRFTRLLVSAVAALAVAGSAAGEEGGAAMTATPEEAPAAPEASAPAPSEEAMPASEPMQQAAAPAASAAAQPKASARPRAPKRKPKLGPVAHDASGQRGRIHTVAPGDTLWDISDAYLGTPWVWPSIWQDNPKVPNPHRIHPGDKLWVSPTAMRRVTDEEAAQLLANEQLPASVDDASPSPLPTVTVPSIERIGFVSASELAAAGAILGSRRPERWYGSEMPVYLSLGAGQVEPGERFDVVRAEHEVEDPATGRTLGVFVERLGWVEVTKVEGDTSEAVIRMAAREIQAGDRLLPRREQAREVAVRPVAPPVAGQIAYLADQRTIHGSLDLVFLNRGSEHGLVVGSPLEVFRQGDQVRDPDTGERRTLPDQVLARLVVVSAEPHTAVAVVTHASEELARGDRFREARAR